MFIHCELMILILALVHTGEFLEGNEAVPHSRPYMVYLTGKKQDGKAKYCGGFLLSEDFVVTAAHCQARSYTALLGVHDVRNLSETRSVSVEQAFPHKDYDVTDFKNDIMILKLTSKISFSKNVRPIAVAGQDDGSLPKSCIVSGWGKADKNTKYMSPVLMEVHVTLIDNEECRKRNSYCSEGEIGPAPGDAGCPLVCEDGRAYGVVSSSLQTASDTRINSYAKIPHYTDWIDSTMKKALKSSNACII